MSSLDHPTNSPKGNGPVIGQLSLRDIFLPILVLMVLGPLVGVVIQLSGITRKYYGEELVQAEAKPPESQEKKLSQARLRLWNSGIGLPLLALAFPLFFMAKTGVSAKEMGWKTTGLVKALATAVLVSLALIPPVYGIQWLMIQWHSTLSSSLTVEHPLTFFAGQSLTGVEWGLLFLTATVGAPFLEEQVFRGVLQPWFSAKPRGGSCALAAAAFICLVQSADLWRLWGEELFRGQFHWRLEYWKAVLPLGFLLVPAFVIFLLEKNGKRAMAGLIGTAALFGMIHGFAWPSPIGLTVLGIGLGLIFQRTGNIFAPICVHGIFNGFALAALAFQPVK
ncbi:MAG: CPBP family intramembrane metalloprotease [Gemmataceae bacterium]|nr:CPBP family intramembrane metalloprotease [Gemmataceae bacterium]